MMVMTEMVVKTEIQFAPRAASGGASLIINTAAATRKNFICCKHSPSLHTDHLFRQNSPIFDATKSVQRKTILMNMFKCA